jgi:hypothetical protein
VSVLCSLERNEMRSFIFSVAFLGLAMPAVAADPPVSTDPLVVELGVPVILTSPPTLDQFPDQSPALAPPPLDRPPVPTGQPEHLKPVRTIIVYDCEPLWLGKRIFGGGKNLVCGVGRFGKRAVVETLDLGGSAVEGTFEFGHDVVVGTGDWIHGMFRPPVYRPTHRIEVYPIRPTYYYYKK